MLPETQLKISQLLVLKTSILCWHKHGWILSQGQLKNIQWLCLQVLKCFCPSWKISICFTFTNVETQFWNVVTGFPKPPMSIWYIRHVQIWTYQCFAEVLTDNMLFCRLDWRNWQNILTNFKTDETFQLFNQENIYSNFLECEDELLFSIFCHCELNIYWFWTVSQNTTLKIELWCKFTLTINYSID